MARSTVTTMHPELKLSNPRTQVSIVRVGSALFDASPFLLKNGIANICNNVQRGLPVMALRCVPMNKSTEPAGESSAN